MQPEKLIIIIPLILFFAFFGSLVIGFFIVIAKLVNSGRKMAWKGTLIDKLHKTKDEFDSKKVNHFYTLVFKTEDGKEIKVGTSKEMFDTYVVGNKAEKKSGELWPKKIN